MCPTIILILILCFYVCLQIQGEAGAAPIRYYITTAASTLGAGEHGATAVMVEHTAASSQYKGMVGTVTTIARQEGPK